MNDGLEYIYVSVCTWADREEARSNACVRRFGAQIRSTAPQPATVGPCRVTQPCLINKHHQQHPNLLLSCAYASHAPRRAARAARMLALQCRAAPAALGRAVQLRRPACALLLPRVPLRLQVITQGGPQVGKKLWLPWAGAEGRSKTWEASSSEIDSCSWRRRGGRAAWHGGPGPGRTIPLPRCCGRGRPPRSGVPILQHRRWRAGGRELDVGRFELATAMPCPQPYSESQRHQGAPAPLHPRTLPRRHRAPPLPAGSQPPTPP
jgi:hypothetical protein